MAARLEVSEVWLSRYLYLARLPEIIAQAWPQITELKELHARTLRPLLADHESAALAEAEAIATAQSYARAGQEGFIPVPKVLARLTAIGKDKREPPATATRDLAELEALGAIRRGQIGGRSTRYFLAAE